MKLIDSHAHIQEGLYPSEIDQVIARAKEAGIAAIINIGTSLAESQEVITIAQRFPHYMHTTVGLHPEDARHEIEKYSLTELEKLLTHLADQSIVVAIGECGLDYGKTGEVEATEKKQQRTIFELQAHIAQNLHLPLIVHCRNAWADAFSILSHFPRLQAIILHSFTGNAGVARQAVDKGYYCSFSGIVTFKNATDIQAAARLVPDDRLLIETDSPFLSPEPFRGQRNEPNRLSYTLQYLCQIRTMNQAVLSSITVENTNKLYHIGSRGLDKPDKIVL